MNLDTLIPGLIGLSLFTIPAVYLLRLLWLARKSRSWPVVVGRVIRAEMAKVVKSRGGQSTLGDFLYKPRIRYTYQVNGQTYTGSTVHFGRWLCTNEAAARAVLQAYPTDSVVEVRYCPTRPELTTLEPRVSGRVYLFLVLALLMMGVILYGIVNPD